MSSSNCCFLTCIQVSQEADEVVWYSHFFQNFPQFIVRSEKVGLKLNIQKMKIMASDPITSWEIDGEPVETVSDFIFLASKITPDGDCSHEIKWLLLLERKVMTNLDSVFKSRDITLSTKVLLARLWFFLWSCMDVRVGLWRKLSAEELMLLNCGVGGDSWEFLGQQGDPTSLS